MCSVIGTPTKDTYPEGLKLAAAMRFKFPQYAPVNLAQMMPTASHEAVDLMRDLLLWDPARRPTAAQALGYPYFQSAQGALTRADESGAPPVALVQCRV